MCRPFEIESRLNVSHLLPGFNVPQQQQQTLYAMPKPAAAMPFMLSSFKPPQFDVMTTGNSNFDSFEDLLDCSILDDDSDLHLNVGDEDFDPTELAILSKYVEDIPLDNADNNMKTEVHVMDQHPGMVTLNLLDDMSLDLNMLSDEDMLLTNMQLKAPIDMSMNTGAMMTSDPWTNQTSSCTSDDHHHDEEAAFPFKSRRFCSVDGCDKRSRSHGLCIAHGGGRRCAVDGCG
ncbi:hypothetical protein DYB26_016461, partial [Aphanomyces astaci]